MNSVLMDVINGDDVIDLLADLCAHWKRNRERGIVPKSVRAAIVLQCHEISSKDLSVRSIEDRLTHVENEQLRLSGELQSLRTPQPATPAPKKREEASTAYPCPTCKADAGESCRTPSGRIASVVHKTRPFDVNLPSIETVRTQFAQLTKHTSNGVVELRLARLQVIAAQTALEPATINDPSLDALDEQLQDIRDRMGVAINEREKQS